MDLQSLSTAELLSRLGNHPLPTIDLSLGRIERFMERIGNPHGRLPPVVHVAGTNGKGSTIAFLQSILQAAGKRVHTYTSPHLVHFNERIVIGGKPISDEMLQVVLREVIGKMEGHPLTFFEATTAAAFLAYAENPADALLLETGLGGRLDATNIIAQPRLTILTPISMDHMEYLGNNLSAIAAEKSGILKVEVPCIVSAQEPEAFSAIALAAKQKSVALFVQGKDWQVMGAERNFEFHQPPMHYKQLKIGLPGAHQPGNAGAAIAAALQLTEFGVDEQAVRTGLLNASWPARLQHLKEGALAAMVGEGELWLDGGHNPAAASALADWLGQRRHEGANIHLVMGMMKDKDIERFLKPLLPFAETVTFLPVPGEARSATPEDLVKHAEMLGHPAFAARNIESALAAIVARNSSRLLVLIAGSLYLAGHILEKNDGFAQTVL